MPKKLLALLLILATFLSSAGFLGFLGLGSKKLTDPVLVPATDVTLPADSVSDLGGGYVLAIDRRTPAVSVIDLRSGRTTPLTTRKQDHDRWIAIINEKVQRGLLGKNAALLLAELERSPDSPPVITPDFRLTSSHCRYALCSTGLTNALVDRQTATLLPLEQDYDIIGVTAWEQLLYHRNDPDGYTLRLCSIDGRELCSAKLPLEEYPFRTVYPMEDGLLLLLNSRLDAETITARTAVMVLDRQLNAGPIIDLSSSSSPFIFRNPRQSTKTGMILLPSPRLDGLLLLDPDGEQWHILTVSDESMSVVTLTDTQLEQLEALYGRMGTMNIVGLSDDGGYALISSLQHGLLRLDLETLQVTSQMDEAALAGVGLTPLDAAYLSWDGGEYVVNYNSVFRLQER